MRLTTRNLVGLLALVFVANAGCYSMQLLPKTTLRLVDDRSTSIAGVTARLDFQNLEQTSERTFEIPKSGTITLEPAVIRGNIFSLAGATIFSLWPHQQGSTLGEIKIWFPAEYHLADFAANGVHATDDLFYNVEDGGLVNGTDVYVWRPEPWNGRRRGVSLRPPRGNKGREAEYTFVLRRDPATQPTVK